MSFTFHYSWIFSPTKATFIKAKYQRLAFVPRLPCKDDDTITVADLSQVESWFFFFIIVNRTWLLGDTKFLPILVLKIFRLFVVLTYACELHFWHDLNRNFISLHSYAQVYGVFNTKAAQTPKTWKP